MSACCSISDVFTWIPRGTVQNAARLIASIATGTEIVTVDGHGLETDDAITFRAEAGGTMPAPLVAGTTYYAIRLGDGTFQVAAAAGGSPIDITTAGSNVVMIIALPWTRWIAQASGEVEDIARAHVVPFVAPIHEVVRTYTAGLVAERALTWSGVAFPPGFTDRLNRAYLNFDRWSKGANLRGTSAPTATNLTVCTTGTRLDPRGWARDGNTVLP